jgi:hypothetical protein
MALAQTNEPGNNQLTEPPITPTGTTNRRTAKSKIDSDEMPEWTTKGKSCRLAGGDKLAHLGKRLIDDGGTT